MAKTKTENYTEEMTAEIVEAYLKGETYEQRAEIIAAQAAKHGKSVPSVRAKLTREKVYIPKEYKNKNGEKPTSKAEQVEALAKMLGVTIDKVDSLERGTMAALKTVVNGVRELIKLAEVNQ